MLQPWEDGRTGGMPVVRVWWWERDENFISTTGHQK